MEYHSEYNCYALFKFYVLWSKSIKLFLIDTFSFEVMAAVPWPVTRAGS